MSDDYNIIRDALFAIIDLGRNSTENSHTANAMLRLAEDAFCDIEEDDVDVTEEPTQKSLEV